VISDFKFQISDFGNLKFEIKNFKIMPTFKRFEDIEVWKLAHEYAVEIYKITDNDFFLKDLRFRGQIRASAGSIPDNIAEGYERDGTKEFIQFLSYAKGSCGESRSQLYRAFAINFIDENSYNSALHKSEKISKSLSGFISYLRDAEIKGTKYK